MQKRSFRSLVIQLRITVIVFILTIFTLLLFSFTTVKIYEDIFTKLGLTKEKGNNSISTSLLGGYLNYYEARNIKNIALNNRAAIVTDLANYTKDWVKTPAFITEYNKFRESYKPAAPQRIQTADEMRADNIAKMTEIIKKTEADLKKGNAQLKPVFEKIILDAKKQISEIQDPNNKMLQRYAQNYPETIKSIEEGYQRQLNQWEINFPANHMFYIKVRLQQFLETTEGVDFSAELYEKNGKKYFVKREYESKGDQWKMAFRAGKEAVETARTFATNWLAEIP